MSLQMLVPPLIFGIVQSADIDWTDPQVILFVRGGYATSITCMFAILVYIYSIVAGKSDDRRVKIKEKKQFGVVQEEARETTVAEYDREAVAKNIKTLLISMCITGFMHSKYSWVLPLVLQAVHQPITMYNNPLFQIHILKQRDGGNNNPLCRPWDHQPPSGIGEIWKQAQAMQAHGKEAAEKKAEKKKAKELNKQLARKGR